MFSLIVEQHALGIFLRQKHQHEEYCKVVSSSQLNHMILSNQLTTQLFDCRASRHGEPNLTSHLSSGRGRSAGTSHGLSYPGYHFR